MAACKLVVMTYLSYARAAPPRLIVVTQSTLDSFLSSFKDDEPRSSSQGSVPIGFSQCYTPIDCSVDPLALLRYRRVEDQSPQNGRGGDWTRMKSKRSTLHLSTEYGWSSSGLSLAKERYAICHLLEEQ
jgi:hypothetical protein